MQYLLLWPYNGRSKQSSWLFSIRSAIRLSPFLVIVTKNEPPKVVLHLAYWDLHGVHEATSLGGVVLPRRHFKLKNVLHNITLAEYSGSAQELFVKIPVTSSTCDWMQNQFGYWMSSRVARTFVYHSWVLFSLVPRPVQKIGEEGLVSTVLACA